MQKTFDIAAEILRETAIYVNPLLTRCEVCLHRVCICHAEPTRPRRIISIDEALDSRERARDMRGAK